jgi:hypothetical protein
MLPLTSCVADFPTARAAGRDAYSDGVASRGVCWVSSFKDVLLLLVAVVV